MLRRCFTRPRLAATGSFGADTRAYRSKAGEIDQQPVQDQPLRNDIMQTSKTTGFSKLRPVVIEHGSEHHQDLASFLAYSARQNLSKTSTVYQGTHYEYTVAEALSNLGFDVARTGKAADRGIDLLGWWHLPGVESMSESPIKVILQCKAFAAKLGPKAIRELEGSFAGAPAHWRSAGVMGVLVATSEATKGMRDAMINSKSPLGFMQVTKAGSILQMLWNHEASTWGLEGYGVTTKFNTSGKDDRAMKQEIALTRNGRVVDTRSQAFK